MDFEVIGPIGQIQVIAKGRGIRSSKTPTQDIWTWPVGKLKGLATVRLPNGTVHEVELHWYEAHGIGRREQNIKRYVDNL